MEIVLAILALILVVSFAPIGIVFTLIQSVTLWNINYFKDYCMNIAGALDQLGNVVMGPVFNLILIKKSKFKFGDKDETISSVLGRNQIDNKLRYLGKRLVALLDWIEEDHSIKSIGS